MMESEKRGEMTKEEEAELKKSVTKGHWNLAKDKASIHAGMEKVQSYEEAFAKIQAPATARSNRRRARGAPHTTPLSRPPHASPPHRTPIARRRRASRTLTSW